MEFQVNDATLGMQVATDVAPTDGGGFFVVWMSDEYDFGSDVVGRRFDGGGAPIGEEFQLNTVTFINNRVPRVATRPDGSFVVAWDQAYFGVGIVARLFDSAGTPLGTEFTVASNLPSDPARFPEVAAGAGGEFVVIWQRGPLGTLGADGSDYGVFGRRFDSNGAAVGDTFQVNTYTVGFQRNARAASDGAGNIVVVWANEGAAEIGAQRYDSSGAPAGTEIQVALSGFEPAVEFDADGNFLVSWASSGADGSGSAVLGRRFASDGTPLEPAFRVNVTTPGYQRNPSVAADLPGRFVVVWTDEGSNDGDGQGVFGRCMSVLCGNGIVDLCEVCDTGGASATCDADCEPPVCGDGTVNGPAGEACDDGNTVAGDGCSATCSIEPCFVCGGEPSICGRPACTGAGKGKMILRDDAADDGRDKAFWKWTNGSMDAADLGDPTSSTSYRLCVWDDAALVASTLIPPMGTCDGKPCWKATARGYRYRDPAGTVAGIDKIVLASGSGNAKLLIKGKGVGVAAARPPMPFIGFQRTSQLQHTGAGDCWESEFSGFLENSAERYKSLLP
jgi:cysteine-rich repeat protein